MSFNSIDDFLDHSGSGGGGRYLKNWKKKGSIRLWLHMRQLPVASWAHNIPQLTVFEDRDTRETKKAFWGRDLCCWEDEIFLKSQYDRDDRGRLESPPKKCMIDRLVDVISMAIAEGQLDWTDEVFRFEGATQAKDDCIIHAGGLTNLFTKKDLSEKQKRELKAKEIYPSQEWMQNFHAKCQYVLTVLDNDDIGTGIQIARQPQSVGDSIKSVIKDARASLGEEEGNPVIHPFCIEITYDEKAQMNKKYHARRIERIKLTPEIERLIRTEPPNLEPSTRPFNQLELRSFLEHHAVVDLPWDRICDVPSTHVEEKAEEPKKEERAPEVGRRRALAEAPKEAPPPPPSSKVAMIPCDKCGHAMREDDTKCGKCGTEYVLDDDKPADPPPRKSVGEVKGDKVPFNRF